MNTTEAVRINAEQGLYVIPCVNGYSCLGFDVCIRWGNGVAAWLRQHGVEADDMPQSERGTMEAYARYSALMDKGREFSRVSGKRCSVDLVPQLIGLEGKRVEVIDRYGEQRRFYVGKSTGWMPCHLEIKTRRSSGGGAVTGAPFKGLRIIGQR